MNLWELIQLTMVLGSVTLITVLTPRIKRHLIRTARKKEYKDA